MTKDLNPQLNEQIRLLERFNKDWATVSIASVSLIITVLALLMAFMALSDAKDARIRAEMQDQQILDLRTQVNVYKIRANRLDAYLKARGIPEEIYDDL